MQEVKKIAVIGPESTGKSTLCEQLANHYNTLWCPEYAREYLLRNGASYIYEDLLEIAKGQMRLEDEYMGKVSGGIEVRSQEIGDRNNQVPDSSETGNRKLETGNFKPFFIDTNMYVMKVWCEFVYEKCHQYILDEIVERKYDLYLLCNIDLPWTKDDLREYPDYESRAKLYHIYKDILLDQHVPWASISGSNEERKLSAIEAIDNLLFTSYG
ncbi:MAG TPA: ATP-binding protein [Segetibacter sp.]|jgi:nicotinamide riboside kinase